MSENPTFVRVGDNFEVYDRGTWVLSRVTVVYGHTDYYLTPANGKTPEGLKASEKQYWSGMRAIRLPRVDQPAPEKPAQPVECYVEDFDERDYERKDSPCRRCGKRFKDHVKRPKKLSEQVAQMEADLAAVRAQYAERAAACRSYEAAKKQGTVSSELYAEAHHALADARSSNNALRSENERLRAEVTKLDTYLQKRVDAEYTQRRGDRQIDQAADNLLKSLRGLTLPWEAFVASEQLKTALYPPRAQPFRPRPSSLPPPVATRLAAIRQVLEVGQRRFGKRFTLADAKALLDQAGGNVNVASLALSYFKSLDVWRQGR